MENKRKHLEFIQHTINRMSINVFMVSVLLIIGVIKNENQVIFFDRFSSGYCFLDTRWFFPLPGKTVQGTL